MKKRSLPVILIMAFGILMSCSESSNDKAKSQANDLGGIESDGTPALISFRSYQNEDTTWGFTIFINNAPFRNFKTLTFKKSEWGLGSKEDAENVAAFFVKRIKNGDEAPKLTEDIMDSLGLKLINMTKQPPA